MLTRRACPNVLRVVHDTRYINKGLVGNVGISPSMVSDTSTSNRLSASWVGIAGGEVKVCATMFFSVCLAVVYTCGFLAETGELLWRGEFSTLACESA